MIKAVLFNPNLKVKLAGATPDPNIKVNIKGTTQGIDHLTITKPNAMSDFEAALESRLLNAFGDLYLPTLTTGQMSRIILFELINASAEFKICIHSLAIREKSPRQLAVHINNEITINLNLNPPLS